LDNSDALSRPTRFKLSDRQRLSWLRLYRSDNVGPATFRDLINHCGSAETALEMLPHMASRAGRKRAIRIATVESAEREMEAIEKFGAHLIGIGEPHYPDLLRQSEIAPPLITVLGNPEALTRSTISIVGARNASMAGIKMARQLARELGVADRVIVSGLARGVDKASHEASLETGTVGVLAGGIDQPYPPENIGLYKEISTSRTSCTITEMAFGSEPRSRDFPKRNRIIAAMSMGLIVVEAAQRSGSLITARLAAEYGRTVFAVPGSPLDPRSHGTNNLIREGATLITGADDVIEGLQNMENAPKPAPPTQKGLFEDIDEMTLPPDDNARALIVSLLSPSPIDLDDIIAHTALKPAQVALVILELDLAGRIERHSGNRVSLVDPVD
jgi:DNA processing protein